MITEIESKTKKEPHTSMDNWFFNKEIKPYNGKKKASTNDAGLTGCLYVEECK